jgi:hypothetical protein
LKDMNEEKDVIKSEQSSQRSSYVDWRGVPQEVYNESKALEYMKDNPFVDALKKAGIEKPDPKALEDAQRRQKYRANAATLAETLRVISDIGSVSAGGNAYLRDNKDVEKANEEYDKEESAYQNKLNEYQKLLLNGILNDRDMYLNALHNIENIYGGEQITESSAESKTPRTYSTNGGSTRRTSRTSTQTSDGTRRASGTGTQTSGGARRASGTGTQTSDGISGGGNKFLYFLTEKDKIGYGK